ncbi:hypothetical protein MRB53_004657 [Persea americana]|uniref:Uncharacterized protein n=1 Tax=Persea americana TaxID=3435 RepID=A0ACC2MB17_PERAE|nr:hypothetical protein MRB53_004657 [Persea americana]
MELFLSISYSTRTSPGEAMVTYLCWVLFLLFNYYSFVGSLNDEGIALLSFKQSIQQDPDGSLSNWDYSDENPCSWSGITCSSAKVISVSIPESGLVGIVPSVLGSLSSLKDIDLRDNRLHGTLPVELFDASSLQRLVLFGNSLSGSLPSEVGKLKDLQTLDLSENLFNGSIPISILQCNRLKTLDLGHNNFTGSLPIGFGSSLIMLEKLNLSYNQFSGSIPSDVGNLSGLQETADFSHNDFSGPIPPSLGNLPEKVYIDLTYNNLSGPIPQSDALVNRGPTAFIGNPGLCGPPLRNACSNSSIPATLPYLPVTAGYSPPTLDGKNMVRSNKRKSLNRGTVIAIVVGDIVGISLIGLMLFYYYSKVVSCKSEAEGGSLERALKGDECLCFRKDGSEAPSEIVEQFGFVPLDLQVDFNIDKLLKSSAYVLGKSGIGIVYKVVLEDGVTLAVRRLGDGDLQRFKEFRTEIEAIGKLKHPNIVTLRAYYWSLAEKLLIYDYIPNGDLFAAIHGNVGTSTSFSPMPWPIRLKIMKGKSPIVLVGVSEMDLVRWVRLSIEEKKPLSDVFDPFLAQESERKEEMIAVLKIALACVQTNAERRPPMRHVLEALDSPIVCNLQEVEKACVIAMDSIKGQGGIQMLLTAEQEAQQMVSSARNMKMKRLKEAKDEAEREAANYRSYLETEFQKKVSDSSGFSGSNLKRLEEDTEKKINNLKSAKLDKDG